MILIRLIISTFFISIFAQIATADAGEEYISDEMIKPWRAVYLDMAPQYSYPMCGLPFLKNRYVLYWEVDWEYGTRETNLYDVDVYSRRLYDSLWSLKKENVQDLELKVRIDEYEKEYIVCRHGTLTCTEPFEDAMAAPCD